MANSDAITTLVNDKKGSIVAAAAAAAAAGAGGAGVSNAGTIGTLTNSGSIRAETAAPARQLSSGGAGGAGVSNSGTIGALINSGIDRRRRRRSGGAMSWAAGDAIYSAGTKASIGPITNSGQIIGNVEIDNQANVIVYGGTGETSAHGPAGRSRSALGT